MENSGAWSYHVSRKKKKKKKKERLNQHRVCGIVKKKEIQVKKSNLQRDPEMTVGSLCPNPKF